jgi:hypothetical protein
MRKNARPIESRWIAPLWPATLVGILLGAALGGLLLHASSPIEATTLVRIYQPIDPDQIMTGIAPSPDSQQSYISGEITYLASQGFAEAVAKQLGETIPPRLSAIQDAQSSIVSLSTTQADFAEAERRINAALTAYSDHVRQQTRERGQAAIDALNAVISRLDAQGQGATSPPGSAPPPNDQQARIQQLVLQRLAIEVQIQRSAGVQVVQPPTETAVKGAPRWSLGAVGGGLTGGLLALAGALAWRKRVGIVTSPSALAGQIEHVLLPTVRLGAVTKSGDAYTGLARSLYAQLPAPRSGRILLVGASEDSGTNEVARLIAFAVAEHARVCFIHLLEGVPAFERYELLANLTDGPTVVIDGGSVDNSPALPGAAENASQIILVVMIRRDVNDTVHMASQLARDLDVPISAVCTRTPRRTREAGPSQPDNGHPTRAAGDTTVDGRLTLNRLGYDAG